MAKKVHKVLFEGEELYDQSRRAETVLNHVLSGALEELEKPKTRDSEVPVASEIRSAPIINQVRSDRATSRVVFVTSDPGLLTSGSAQQNEYVELASVFDEVHVLVLVNRKGKDTNVRIGSKTWIYSVHSSYWLGLPFFAKNTAYDMLVFNESFRPDIVVGTDPYEAGLAALFIAKEFARPVQVYVSEDFTAPSFSSKPHNNWRRRIAKYVLRRVKSVRVKTGSLQDFIKKEFKNVADLEVLPKFYNFSGYLKATPAFNIHDTYKDFVFIMLAFGPLVANSNLHDTFTALYRTLKNPRIGLIVIGSGPAKKLFEDKVKLLGIERSVVFLNSVEDPVSYMKTADALIETATDKDSEEHIMRAAAAGLPIIAVETDLRKDLFKDGQSAFLCPPGDSICISQKLTKFINGDAFRKIFSQTGEQIAKDRLIEDPASYYRAVRDSIEVILEKSAPEEIPQSETEVKPDTVSKAEDGLIYPKENHTKTA